MSTIDITGLKKLINDVVDQWAAGVAPTTPGEVTEVKNEEKVLERVLPEGKRAVRSKTSGDRVYLLDDTKTPPTRQWITNPEVLKALGFDQTDVGEVDDSELMKYNVGAAIYKVDNGQS